MKNKIKKIFTAVLSFVLAMTFSVSVLAEEVISPEVTVTPKSYSLSATKYTYTGSAKKPKVTVKDKEGKVISAEYYTVTYSNNVLPGKAKATVKMNDSNISKTLYFTIIPKKAGKPSVKSAKQKQFTVTVSEDLTATGYNIRYSTSKSFKNAKNVYMAVTTDVRKTIKNVKNTTYYVKVCNYKMIDGKKVYGKWSSTVKVDVKLKSAHAKLPDEMMESYIADSLTYLGYKTSKHKSLGTYLQDCASGPRTPMSVRSNIGYGGVPSGQETVKDKSTVSGKAPNVAKFEKYGLCCAGFVSYYYLNYLPNIAGVDTSYIKSAIKKSGYGSQTCESWEWAAKYLVKKGKAKVVDKVKNGQTLAAADLDKLEIGDLITFRIPSTGRSCGHVAVYAGKNNEGDHFVAHVGSDEGPVFQTLQRFQNVVNRADGCAYSVVYRFNDLPNSKYDYSVKLSKTKYTYTGKAIKPAVIVKDATGKKISSKYYTVHYSNNVKVGKGKAHIVFKGKYKGTRDLYFKIEKKKK